MQLEFRYCLKKVYTNKAKLIEDSEAPKNVSLATFKPTKIEKFSIEPTEREWKDDWVNFRDQIDMFATLNNPEQLIPKVPYKFYYHFTDDEGTSAKLMIEDWEISALYWNCLRRSGGDEEVAKKKVRQKYFDDFATKKDIYLFLGTTKQFHQKRSPNPFVIIGVFYPPTDNQTSLF